MRGCAKPSRQRRGNGCSSVLLWTEERGVSTASRPLVLVLAHGLRARDLAGLSCIESAAATPLAVTEVPDDPEQFLAGEGDASATLFDLGVAVDRSSLTLRPRGRTDAMVLETLRHRPTGPAPVTLLSTRAALDQALGGGDLRHAVAEVDAFVQQARTILRAGDLPEVWLCACDAAQTARVTFDFAGHYERAFGWPWRQSLHASVRAERAVVRADDQRALEHAAAVLGRAPFRSHGELSQPAPGTLHFTARGGVAFGRRRLAARRGTSSRATALLPTTGEPLPQTLTFAEWLTRFWLRAQALHAPADRARAQRGAAAAPSPTTLQKMTLPSPGA